MYEPTFAWPPGFSPNEARLYLRNELDMDAPRASVWAALVAAPQWTSWFPNATGVELPVGSETLGPEMRFKWTQTGVRLETVVVEFVPERRIAWRARSPLIDAYHTWDLSPSERGCLVITDETQNGIMPTLLGFAMKPRMLAIHDLWLRNLESRARTL